ncbi:MAG: D-glycerate dehydrogenase [Chloroflexi bacterium]|nr:D-glycerate dehydrogenase [Chloroflexota bacterium]
MTSPLPPALVDRIRALMPREVQLDVVRSASRDHFGSMAADAGVLLVAGNLRRIDAALLALAPNVRFVQQVGIGYDCLDLSALQGAGIVAAYTPGATAVPTAEHTLLLMLALLRRFAQAESSSRQGSWSTLELAHAGLGDLAGTTVGLVGFGQVGRAVAQRLRAFEAHVVYTARQAVDHETEQRLDAQFMSLDELLGVSQMVSLHVPLSDATRGLVGDVALAKMMPGAFLVNTSRGGIVDEAALRRALDSGHLGGAALDVLDAERAGGNRFGDLAQVIVTPHVGGPSRAGTTRALEMAVTNIARYLRGEPVLDLIPAPANQHDPDR